MGLQIIDWNISAKWEMLDFYVWLSIFIITIIYHLHVWKYYWYMWLIINNELEKFGTVHLSYEPYCFSEGIMSFSHNKLANSIFSHGFSTKRTWPLYSRCRGRLCWNTVSRNNWDRLYWNIYYVRTYFARVQHNGRAGFVLQDRLYMLLTHIIRLE